MRNTGGKLFFQQRIYNFDPFQYSISWYYITMKSEIGQVLGVLLDQKAAVQVEKELMCFGVKDCVSLIGLSAYCIDKLVIWSSQKQLVRDLQAYCQHKKSLGGSTSFHSITKSDVDKFRKHGFVITPTPQSSFQQHKASTSDNRKNVLYSESQYQCDRMSDLSSVDKDAYVGNSTRNKVSVVSGVGQS